METTDKVMRLAKPRKKGVLRIIFSRLFVILLLIILQVLIIISIYDWFSDYMPHFTGLQILFTLLMIAHLFNSDMDSSAKLTWMVIISIFPVPGTIFLLFTEKDIGHRAIKARINQLLKESDDALMQDVRVMEQLKTDASGTDDLCKYLNRTGCFPIYENTQVTYFPLGEDKFKAMLEELDKAEKYIFMEYFIIEEGYMWGKILEILTRKAGEGVEVCVMYDGMCELSQLPHDYTKRMQKVGIKCKAFSPIRPFLSTYYNYRDHRKILVIDGKVAFNGGINLADEYINQIERFGHWKDTAVMLKGEAAKSFALMFLQMWNISERKPEFHKYLKLPEKEPEKEMTQKIAKEREEGFVMPFSDCPLDDDKVGENVYMDILNRATDYVHIMTPYLILDGELQRAIEFAAQRGVDVKLILPGIPDKKAAYALAKSHYRALLGSGVKIYEYTPGFVHAKVFVSDDQKGVVGTINLDYRSLYHHFECATYLYKVDCIKDIEKDFDKTLEKCREVTFDTIRHEKIYYKIMGSVMKFIAPLM